MAILIIFTLRTSSPLYIKVISFLKLIILKCHEVLCNYDVLGTYY